MFGIGCYKCNQNKIIQTDEGELIMKKGVITVVGKDRVGIICGVANILAEQNVNILDISQTILQDIFTMMMIVDIENCKCDFSELSKQLTSKGEELGVDIRIQLEKIFSSMHRI